VRLILKPQIDHGPKRTSRRVWRFIRRCRLCDHHEPVIFHAGRRLRQAGLGCGLSIISTSHRCKRCRPSALECWPHGSSD
jgi:hypothetical protein